MIEIIKAILIILSSSSVNLQVPVTVTTPLGGIMGIQTSYHGEKVNSFYAVPYAEPPERFKKPKPIKPWGTTWNALSPGKLCMQLIEDYVAALLPNTELTEDCLYVDIHVPGSLSEQNNKAVVVWIPGGADFRQAQTAQSSFKYLSVFNDVIIVTVSYRVDVFGFLSTGDDKISGNLGLWDQKLAIQWVKANINTFGGDASRITLVGVKSGAISVGFQATNPLNAQVFQRIIVHSSFSNSKEAIVTNAADFAQQLAKSYCQDANPLLSYTSQQIYDCLLSKPAKELLDAASKIYPVSPSFSFAIGPVIDNDFISETANLDQINAVDVLVFLVPNEGFYDFIPFVAEVEEQYNITVKDGVPNKVLCEKIAAAIVGHFYGNKTGLKDLLCDEYTKSDPTEQSREVVRLIGDFLYYSPVVRMLQNHAVTNAGNRFLGLFSKQEPFPGDASSYSWVDGPVARSDLIFLTLKQLSLEYGLQFEPADQLLAERMMQYWSSFIKNGYADIIVPRQDNKSFGQLPTTNISFHTV